MITIAYFTSRKDPKFEWFIHTLNREATPDNKWKEIKEIIVVDFYANEPERLKFLMSRVDVIIPEHVKIKHTAPKPCPWQGEFKVTPQDHFAASNARNTAFAMCESEFIACVDDLSFFRHGWIDNVLWAAHGKCVILGAYTKVNQVTVDSLGNFKFIPSLGAEGNDIGVDSRLSNPRIKDGTAHRVEGEWLFGCSFAMPIEYAYQTNGFDEACDGMGFEDVLFGMRLNRVTDNIWYCPNMFTYESDELHSAPGNAKFVRRSRMVTKNGLMPHKDGVMSDHAMLQWTRESSSPHPFWNKSLIEQKNKYLLNGKIELEFISKDGEAIDWRDGRLLKDLAFDFQKDDYVNP